VRILLIASLLLLTLSLTFAVDAEPMPESVVIDVGHEAMTPIPVSFNITVMDYGAEEHEYVVTPTNVTNTAKQQNKNFERQQSL